MTDILGREVKIGDIIAFSSNGLVAKYAKFITPHLAVISNITTGRVRKDKDGNVTTMNALKVVAYEITPGSNYITMKIHKNGKPNFRPIMSTQPLVIDKSTLPQDWLESYDKLRTAMRI